MTTSWRELEGFFFLSQLSDCSVSRDATSGLIWRATQQQSRHDRASEQDDWDCVDELVDEETFSQAVAS